MTTILKLERIAKAFGTDEVLREVSFAVNSRDRLGLVGVNGSGKTTLLKIILGQLQPDEGEVITAKGLSIGHLAQSYRPKPGYTVLEEASAVFKELFAMEARLRMMEEEMAGDLAEEALASLYREYARLTERFEEADGYMARSLIEGVLIGLGLGRDFFDQHADTLSGGELTRLGLARLLLQKPDMLLLDEPTNHLDLEALEWLEGYLLQYTGAMIIVSHDRYFLDAVCTDMAEILFGVAEVYPGNYSRYLAQREERVSARTKAYDQQQREIARQRAIITRFKQFNREKSIRAAESREKALARMELMDRPEEERQIAFRFKAARRLGEQALLAEGLSQRFGDKTVFEDIRLHLYSGDRAVLIGPNGIGKTTLLKCILGIMAPDSGEVRFGAQADIGYYDQRQQNLDPDKDILTEVWDDFPRLTQSQVRGALALFQFIGEDVFVPIRLLSGGEKGRVALTKLMLRQDNFLVLDEPTNHLDAASREVLEKALEAYEGTILAVSHDRFFINRLANKILYMSAEGIEVFEGNYEDYLASRTGEGEEQTEEGPTRTALVRMRKLARQEAARQAALTQAVEGAMDEVKRLEKALKAAQESQMDPEVYTRPDKAAQQAKVCRELQSDLEAAYQKWGQAEEALENLLSPQENSIRQISWPDG
ncbi:MAG: ABC-F family ATP-binding cassette domain-containing protein [Clostridiales bacterium]|nr:ABC-F family ATP-binding cassette domain-containing protein [Clostridiales bacterium]